MYYSKFIAGIYHYDLLLCTFSDIMKRKRVVWEKFDALSENTIKVAVTFITAVLAKRVKRRVMAFSRFVILTRMLQSC